MFFYILATIFVSVLSYYFYAKAKHKYENLPPGPVGIPVLGNMLQMGGQLHNRFKDWGLKYGDIFTIKMASLRFVVINDLKLGKEIFSSKDYAGRIAYDFVHDLYDGGLRAHGIMNTEGAEWEELRRFTLRQLRDFGFGKQTMETYIMDELNELIQRLKDMGGEPVTKIKEKLTFPVLGALWHILSGQKCKHDDPNLLRIMQGMTNLLRETVEKPTGMLIFTSPFLRKLFPEMLGFYKLRSLLGETRSFFTQSVEEHKKTYSPDCLRDFMDAFLQEIKKTTDTKSPFYGELGERMLVSTVNDLFMAGSDTTSATLAWALLYLSKFPKVQEKLQAEVESITGNFRPSSLTDRPNMPYVECVIAEVLRFSSVVASGIPHRSTITGNVRGYTIPKNSTIIVNLHYIHRDPKHWGQDADIFRPERFLDMETTPPTFKKNEALVAFSLGKRQCPGESLARDTLFLFITNIFQKFDVKLVSDKGFEPIVNINLYPQEFSVKFITRD